MLPPAKCRRLSLGMQLCNWAYPGMDIPFTARGFFSQKSFPGLNWDQEIVCAGILEKLIVVNIIFATMIVEQHATFGCILMFCLNHVLVDACILSPGLFAQHSYCACEWVSSDDDLFSWFTSANYCPALHFYGKVIWKLLQWSIISLDWHGNTTFGITVSGSLAVTAPCYTCSMSHRCEVHLCRFGMPWHSGALSVDFGMIMLRMLLYVFTFLSFLSCLCWQM